VRRALAISLMLFFTLPLVSSVFGTAMAEGTVPACCRRDGKHHCAMPSEGLSEGSGARAFRSKCPYTPGVPPVLVLPSFTPATSVAIFAGIIRHPAVSPQTEAQLHVSFDRVRQKRGPPALLA